MVVEVTRCGVTFRATRRTVQHLDWTIARLRRRIPWARLHIIQPCYNDTVAASAGTHDRDAVFDLRISGIGWWRAQWFLRNAGWACWFRHTGQWAPRDAWHIHAISLPTGLPADPTAEEVGAAYRRIGLVVGEFIDGGLTSKGSTRATSQVEDYYIGGLGLKGEQASGSDTSPFPADINATVYVYKPFQAA